MPPARLPCCPCRPGKDAAAAVAAAAAAAARVAGRGGPRPNRLHPAGAKQRGSGEGARKAPAREAKEAREAALRGGPGSRAAASHGEVPLGKAPRLLLLLLLLLPPAASLAFARAGSTVRTEGRTEAYRVGLSRVEEGGRGGAGAGIAPLPPGNSFLFQEEEERCTASRCSLGARGGTRHSTFSKMASLVRQTSRCNFLLRTYNIVNGTEQRGRQPIKTWTYSLEQWGFPLLSPYRRRCQPVLKSSRNFLFANHVEFYSSNVEPDQNPENKTLSFVHKLDTETEPFSDIEEGLEEESPSHALENISEEEAIHIPAKPPLPPASFTLKDYVDHSETLRKLVHLGVDLSKVERRKGAGQLLLQLDFEKDIQKILLFLKDVGLKDDQLGKFLTKNPYILKEHIEDLQTRITYLTAKKFSKEAITEMVSRAPYLLLFPVERLDNRYILSKEQESLASQGLLNRSAILEQHTRGDQTVQTHASRQTRELVTRLPRLLTGGLEHIKENLQVFELELGFNRNEIRHIVHTVPRSLDSHKRKLRNTFDYLHNTMGIPHKLILHFPQVFNLRLMRIQERHMFLEFLGRAQYDPVRPNYVSLDKLATLSDDAFCTEIARAKLEDFKKFLKTL